MELREGAVVATVEPGVGQQGVIHAALADKEDSLQRQSVRFSGTDAKKAIYIEMGCDDVILREAYLR